MAGLGCIKKKLLTNRNLYQLKAPIYAALHFRVLGGGVPSCEIASNVFTNTRLMPYEPVAFYDRRQLFCPAVAS